MPQAESTSAFEVLGVQVDVVQVADPELFQRFFADPVATGTGHFLYGGAPGVAESLAAVLDVVWVGLSTPKGPRFVAKSLAELFRESLQDRAL